MSSSSCSAPSATCSAATKPARRLPASSLKRSSFVSSMGAWRSSVLSSERGASSRAGSRGPTCRSSSSCTCGPMTGASSSGRATPSLPAAAAACSPSSAFFFAFLRIFTRSTMGCLQVVIAGGRGDAGRVDDRGVFAEGVEQSCRGEGIDDSRDAAAHEVNLPDGFGAEGIALPPGHVDAMLDVAGRVFLIQGTETIAHADALAQGRVGGTLQSHLELGLPDEEDGQQVLVIELEVRQQPDLVEGLLGGDELRLVDDQHRLPRLLIQLEEAGVGAGEQHLARPPRRVAAPPPG